MLRQTGRPYAVEVVADLYDVFASGSVKHPLRPRFFAGHLYGHCDETVFKLPLRPMSQKKLSSNDTLAPTFP